MSSATVITVPTLSVDPSAFKPSATAPPLPDQHPKVQTIVVVEHGATDATGPGTFVYDRKQTVLAALNVAVIVLAAIALICAGSAIHGKWSYGDSSTDFILFVGITGIFQSFSFLMTRLLYLRRVDSTAATSGYITVYLWCEAIFHAVYAIFFFASATDIAATIDGAGGSSEITAARAYAAFAYFASFTEIAATAIAALVLRMYYVS